MAWEMASSPIGGEMHMAIFGSAEVALFAFEESSHYPLWVSLSSALWDWMPRPGPPASGLQTYCIFPSVLSYSRESHQEEPPLSDTEGDFPTLVQDLEPLGQVKKSLILELAVLLVLASIRMLGVLQALSVIPF